MILMNVSTHCLVIPIIDEALKDGDSAGKDGMQGEDDIIDL